MIVGDFAKFECQDCAVGPDRSFDATIDLNADGDQPDVVPGEVNEDGLYINGFGRPGRRLESTILLKTGIFKDIGAYNVLPEHSLEAPNYLISDSICADLFADDVLRSLRATGVRVELLVVPTWAEANEPSTEPSKTVAEFHRLIDEILKKGITKHSCIISLGGGVVNNICGLLASFLFRGISLIHLTTSTMGAFDAAIDFKQAINHDCGKNLLGAYYPASSIVIDPAVFSTVTPRHMLNGLAEALKHGLTQSQRLTDLIVQPLLKDPNVLTQPAYLEAVCRAVIEVKVPTLTWYNSSDFNEMCPQYGHAIGHAIEHLSWHPPARCDGQTNPKPSPLLHGEAVAIGMCISAEVAFLMGICDEECVEQHYRYVRATGLPAYVPSELTTEEVIAKMAYDKHHVKTPTMGLCSSIGCMAKKDDDSYTWAVQPEVVEKAIQLNAERRDTPSYGEPKEASQTSSPPSIMARWRA
mmetsp:Transcript_4450/g.14348  ORF Transcript_4450/g.14348 Transcript_4450/m.14348 type:complete len:469 (+) Transcript_4450:116-1522(+)